MISQEDAPVEVSTQHEQHSYAVGYAVYAGATSKLQRTDELLLLSHSEEGAKTTALTKLRSQYPHATISIASVEQTWQNNSLRSSMIERPVRQMSDQDFSSFLAYMNGLRGIKAPGETDSGFQTFVVCFSVYKGGSGRCETTGECVMTAATAEEASASATVAKKRLYPRDTIYISAVDQTWNKGSLRSSAIEQPIRKMSERDFSSLIQYLSQLRSRE